MNYSYQSYIKLKFFGCPVVVVRKLYPSKFSVGEILYILKKAKLGILEKVAIKKINLSFVENEAFFIYKDTFNSLHNEKDLCRYIEAQQEVEGFQDYLQELIMNSNGCGITEHLMNSINSPQTTDVRKTLQHIKHLIKGLSAGNRKTKYIDVDIKAADIIKSIDSILLDGGRP